MCSIASIWLFFVLLPCFVVVSDSLDCKKPVFNLKNIQKTASSILNKDYGVENVQYGEKPWVSNFTYPSNSSQSIYLELNFGLRIFVDKFYMYPREVKGFDRGNLGRREKCYVTTFVVEYKTDLPTNSSSWIKLRSETDSKYYKTFKNDRGRYPKQPFGINKAITAMKIFIRKWHICPAVDIEIYYCGACPHLPQVGGQALNCTDYNQICTYSCMLGYKQTNSGNGIKTCNADGSWSGGDIQCDRGPCDNPSICDPKANCVFQRQISSGDSYTCSCENGYTGDGKPGNCRDINECLQQPFPCHSYANCFNTAGSYSCNCTNGFSGDGKSCSNINECNNGHNCDDSAQCVDTTGSYTCTCKSGYSGNGRSCIDINECKSHPCNSLAICSNSPGTYSCSCRTGYMGVNGVNCQDVDECSPRLKLHDCHKYANCKNTVGSFTCTCKEGFQGDGNTCIGDAAQITKSSKSDTQTLRFGDPLEIFCVTVGKPIPSIQWTVIYTGQTQAIEVSDGVTPLATTGRLQSTLRIDKIKLEQSGTYICTATNDGGSEDRKINISVDGTPFSPEEVKVDVRVMSLFISWKKPNSGASAIKEYTVYYETGNTKQQKSENNETFNSELKGLTPNTKYTIWVVAINDQGESEPKKMETTTDVPNPKVLKKPEQDLSLSSETSIAIKVSKQNNSYISFIQVIVGKRSSRKKRQVSRVPEEINDYQTANKNGESYYIAAQLENKDVNFIVGDDETYHDYHNAKLEPGKSYGIYLRGVALNNKEDPRYGNLSEPLEVSIKKVKNGGGSTVALAVGLSVMVLVLIVLVVLAVLYVRSRHPKTLEIDPETGKKKRQKKSSNAELLPLTNQGGSVPNQTLPEGVHAIRVPRGESSNDEEVSNLSDDYELPEDVMSWEISRESLDILKIVGSGAFGQVAKGVLNQENKSSEVVAIKMVKEGCSESDRLDLLSELQIMKKLTRHPNVICLLGCVTKSEPILVVISFVPFGDLLGYLRKSRGQNDHYYNDPDMIPRTSLTSEELMQFAEDIASGMEFLESNYVIHRDLAARNVLVGQELVCKITDFGMARDVYKDEIYTKTSKGRIPIKWTAYEALMYKIYTSQSDVWSYGIVLYEIFTIGGVPYPGVKGRDLYRLLQTEYRLEKPAHITQEIYSLMLQCWKTTPSERPSFYSLKETMSNMKKHHEYVNLQDYDSSIYENIEDLY